MAIEFDLPSEMVRQVKYVGSMPRIRALNAAETRDLLSTVFLQKFDKWAYEKEWRTIRYRETKNTWQLDPKWITGIVFGYACSDKDRRRVKKLVCKGRLRVKYGTVTKSEESYELSLVQEAND